MARQIDILMHAHDYLRELNSGRDPLSGEWLPSFSAAKEAEVRKSLFFSAKGLERIIIYDNTDKRPPFSITPEQAARLRPEGGSISISQLSKLINRAIDLLQCRGLSNFVLIAWLDEGKFIRKSGSGQWELTERGRAIGITLYGEGGLSLDQNAQQFVIDHIQELASFARGKNPQGKRSRVSVAGSDTRGNAAAMRRLANGLHPFSGAPLNERDPLMQERLQRCFEYTAWALERAVKAGYFTAKGPFTLPQELWKEIAISQERAMVVAFVRRVNALLPDPTAVNELTAADVQEYLKSEGLLVAGADEAGKTRMFPTPTGNALGIERAEATRKDGVSFTGVFYSAEAQQYLVEHLGEIIEMAAAGR